jgi:hypothetical protein
MAEPSGPVPSSPPSPFDPAAPFEPISPSASPKGSGCAKAAVVGCLGLLVALGVVMVLAVTQAPKLLSWLFDQTQAQLETRYAGDVTPADRERVRAAFGAAGKAVDEKRMDPVALQKVQTQLMEVMSSQGPVHREQAVRLAAALEELAASKPPQGGGG